MPAIKGKPVPLMRGENNAQAVLTWDTVRAIRKEYVPGEVTQNALALRYGVSRRNIRHILCNTKWHDPDFVPLPQHR